MRIVFSVKILCFIILTNFGACFRNFYDVESKNVATNCNCPQPCNQGVYDVTVSTAKWPSGSFIVPGCNDSISQCTELYRDNALMIEVFYEQLNFRLLTESPAYTMVNLISDFGGQAGLWLGLSVVTLVEVLVLFAQLFGYNCKKKPLRNDVTDLSWKH